MSTILHLSDLHLGDPDAWERRTDEKVRGVVPADEDTRMAVVKTSLEGVNRHVTDQGLKIDAVVVSGDLTSRYDNAGFERFTTLVKETTLVSPEQVVVVPGNHDVDWTQPAGTEEKYAGFVEHTRGQGMRTPFLDGVDDPAEPDKTAADPVLDLDDAAVVAVNSANWCGVKLGDDEVYDIARVSAVQLDYLTETLRDHELENRVRIAILHHHLLPVTEDEQVKKFESFTNLARLRAWLREHRFHVVLHGHKHQPALTWDHIYELDRHDLPARRVLIVSAPSPDSWGDPVCRLIRVGEASGRRPVTHAPRLAVDTVLAERPERRVEPAGDIVELDGGVLVPGGLVAIDARTADAAYEQLQDALARGSDRLLNVTCVVREAESAEALPTNYEADVDRETWFEDAVAWWQKASPALVASGDAPFNHGERLHSSSSNLGALDIAASRLGSTKATVLLISNAELQRGGKAPAFVALQLVRVADSEGDRLDCVGYFRKQDLTLWWPVNVGELRVIQRYVLDLDEVEGVRAGRLVTVAAEAIRDDVLPQLAGTAVDRAVDLRPELLMRLAYRAAHPEDQDRDEVCQEWAATLKDIGEARDFPSLGVERLLDHLRVFRDVGGKEHVDDLISALEAVYDRAHRARTETRKRSDRERHSNDLFGLVEKVLDAVDASFSHGTSGEAGTPSGRRGTI
jgi:Icc-related predicted phosphoesterase